LIGAALITLLPTIFQPFAAYKILAEGAILVVAFQYLPEGIFGKTASFLSRMSRQATRGAQPVIDGRAP